LLEFLSDPKVTREAKRRSFDLLADHNPTISRSVINKYHDSLVSTITRIDPMSFMQNQGGVIFPAAMRFAAVYGLLDSELAFSYVWTLATSADRFNRVEAARSLRTFTPATSFGWVPMMTLQLSYDVDPEVKLQSIAALSEQLDKPSHGLPATSQRLGQLLERDGVTIPLAVLQAVSGKPVSDQQPRGIAIGLRAGHVSRRVRNAAAAIET
jgi:hypothetical protein